MIGLFLTLLICTNLTSTLDVYSFNKESVKIGDQIWMKKNLGVVFYQNGDSIPHVQDPQSWSVLNSGAWCYVDENITKYGKLYNWYAVNDSRGLAPPSWNIPSNNDWQKLIDYLGDENSAGMSMKSKYGWKDGGCGNNNSKLNFLPGGGRVGNGNVFGSIGGNIGFWTSTEIQVNSGESTSAFSRNLDYYNNKVYNYRVNKRNGFYVRCLKN
jgi:uncharacterized protein (TIGR02145 family)